MGVTKRVFQVVYMCRRDPSTYQNTPGPSGHTNVLYYYYCTTVVVIVGSILLIRLNTVQRVEND